ncbi:MAG: DHH family phosphoesterase [Elusimicrobiota bacterium]|nr:DHH family phosphoesterase [Elusimicrobiota bacterium]
MNYSEFVASEALNLNFAKVSARIEAARGKKALVFCHDDPDGITSGIIIKKLLESRDMDVTVKVPVTMELEETRLRDAIAETSPDIIFVADKGTMGYYDAYADIHDNIIILDHHPLLGEELKRVTVVNPVLDSYKRCSASFVAHMLSTFCGEVSPSDDIASLIGLKGDWAIEPATDDISDYVKSFYDEMADKYSWLLNKIESRPTMFEVRQREKTTLLNQAAEIIFALGGGGFQYFYNERDKDLADITSGDFALNVLEKWLKNCVPFTTEVEFISAFSDSGRAKKIFDYYLSDWKETAAGMLNADKIKTVNGTDIYLFKGEKVKLMPMVGSVILYEFASQNDDVLFIMFSDMGEKGVHFSFRSKNGKLHCGNFAHDLAVALQEKFGKEHASGGGHPFAAECRTKKKFPVGEIMALFDEKLSAL